MVSELESETSNLMDKTEGNSEATGQSGTDNSDLSHADGDEMTFTSASLKKIFPADHLPTIMLQKHMQAQIDAGIDKALPAMEFTDSNASDSTDRPLRSMSDEDYLEGGSRGRKRSHNVKGINGRRKRRRADDRNDEGVEIPVVDRKLKRKVRLPHLVKANILPVGSEVEFKGEKAEITSEGKLIYRSDTGGTKLFKSLSPFATYVFKKGKGRNSKTQLDGWITVMYNGVIMDYYRAMYVVTFGSEMRDDGYRQSGCDRDDILGDNVITLTPLSEMDDDFEFISKEREVAFYDNSDLPATSPQGVLRESSGVVVLDDDQIIASDGRKVMESNSKEATEYLIPSSIPPSSQGYARKSKLNRAVEVDSSDVMNPFGGIKRALDTTNRVVDTLKVEDGDFVAGPIATAPIVDSDSTQGGEFNDGWKAIDEDIYIVSPSQSSPPTPIPSRKIFNKQKLNKLFLKYGSEEASLEKDINFARGSPGQAIQADNSAVESESISKLAPPPSSTSADVTSLSPKLPVFNLHVPETPAVQRSEQMRPIPIEENMKYDPGSDLDGNSSSKDYFKRNDDDKKRPKKVQSTLFGYPSLFKKLKDMVSPRRDR